LTELSDRYAEGNPGQESRCVRTIGVCELGVSGGEATDAVNRRFVSRNQPKMIRRFARAVELLQEAAFDRYGIPRTRNGRISKACIERYLPANPVIIDCGAHDGTDTVVMARRWPGAQLYAFEPVPALYQRLRASTEAHSNVKCFPLAISNRIGTEEMHISAGTSDGSSSLLTPATHLEDHPSVLFETTRRVETTTFADWAIKEAVGRVDLFWLDMQGSELLALTAAQDLLRTARAVHSEVSVRMVYHGITLYPEFRDFMQRQGFRVAVEAIPKGWDSGNVLFVRA
jgi:FkbM family methyltransferase